LEWSAPRSWNDRSFLVGLDPGGLFGCLLRCVLVRRVHCLQVDCLAECLGDGACPRDIACLHLGDWNRCDACFNDQVNRFFDQANTFITAIAASAEPGPHAFRKAAVADSDASDAYPERAASFTGAQQRVFGLLMTGLPNKLIAYEIGVSEATIKAHVSAVLRKLRVRSRAQAIALSSAFERKGPLARRILPSAAAVCYICNTSNPAVSFAQIAQGGVHYGWSHYLKDGKPRFAHNYLGSVTTIASDERMPAVPVTVGYEFAYDGGKPGSGGVGTLFINGKKVASGRIDRTIPFIFGVETADVGVDLYTPVTDDYKKGDNRFIGKINKVTIDLKTMNAADEDAAEKAAEQATGIKADQE